MRWGRPCATCRVRRWPWVLRLRRQPRGCRTSRSADLRTEYVCSPRVSGAPDITLVRLVPVFWHVIVFMPTTDQHGESLSMRSEEHTSELQSLMRISYAVFCLKK